MVLVTTRSALTQCRRASSFVSSLAADGQGANQKKRAAEHRGGGRKDLARQIIDELRALLAEAKGKR
jgi:hypothetical protein